MIYLATYYYTNGQQTGIGNMDVSQHGGIKRMEDVRGFEKAIAKQEGFDRVVMLNIVPIGREQRKVEKDKPVPLSTRRCYNCAMHGKCDIYEMGFTDDDFCSWWEDEEET